MRQLPLNVRWVDRKLTVIFPSDIHLAIGLDTADGDDLIAALRQQGTARIRIRSIVSFTFTDKMLIHLLYRIYSSIVDLAIVTDFLENSGRFPLFTPF